jgi:hypothetical protein
VSSFRPKSSAVIPGRLVAVVGRALRSRGHYELASHAARLTHDRRDRRDRWRGGGYCHPMP